MGNLFRLSEPASLALHATAVLARRPGERLANQEIARALRASEHHLAKVMPQLVRAEIVQSTRGPRGGFELREPPESTTLLQVFEAVEGPLAGVECLLNERVCNGGDCMIRELSHSVHEHVREYLASTTLARLAARFQLVPLDP